MTEAEDAPAELEEEEEEEDGITDPTQQPGDNAGTEQNLGLKFDKMALFSSHPESYELFSSIDSGKLRKNIRHAMDKLHSFSKDHTTLLGSASKMTYDELVTGMLFDGEEIVPVRPLLVKNYRRRSNDDVLREERFGIRFFLTSRRMFMLDAEAHHVPTLEDHDDDLGFMRTRELELNYVVRDELWYNPIPLMNLKGVSLDVHYQTVAHGWLWQTRPILICAGIAAFAIAMFYYANSVTPVMVLLERSTIPEAPPTPRGTELTTNDGSTDSDSSSWSGIPGSRTIERDEHEAYKALFICIALVAAIPVAFFRIEAYSRSEFSAKMAQRRSITLGALDPVTQVHSVYELILDDRYGMKQIQEYVHLLQEFSPHLAGQVLG